MNNSQYTVISASDRPGSNTSKIAQHYLHLLEEQGIHAEYFSMEDLPSDFFTEGDYGASPHSFAQVLNSAIIPSTHLVFAVPEYNGSFPGVLKHFLDIVNPKIWNGKKAALVGIATGRGGNMRGLDHLTGVFHYLQMEVLSDKPLFSSIHLHLDGEGKLVNQEYRMLASAQVERFRKF
jgi:NAD(P)H-dependent FMN reductase